MYVTFPSQVGAAEIEGAEATKTFPQLSVTTGTVGATISAAHATVEAVFAGSVKSGLSKVKTWVKLVVTHDVVNVKLLLITVGQLPVIAST